MKADLYRYWQSRPMHERVAAPYGANQYSISSSPSATSPQYGNPGAQGGNTQLLANLATMQRGTSAQVLNHHNVQPVFDIYANVQGRDLGGVRLVKLRMNNPAPISNKSETAT